MLERFDVTVHTALERAQDEARSLGHGYIGTEHLVLGLLSAADTPAVRALREAYGVDDGRRDADAIFQRTPGATRYIPDDVALASVGVDAEAVRRQAREQFGPSAAPGRMGNPPFTPRAAEALRRTVATMDARGRSMANADDLLVGVLADEGAAPTLAMREHGVDLDAIRAHAEG